MPALPRSMPRSTNRSYQETSKSGATSIAFREASLSLEVTPQITPDGKVIMTVKVTKDEPDFVNALNDVPPFRTESTTHSNRLVTHDTRSQEDQQLGFFLL